MIEKLLNRLGDLFVKYFPGKSKDDDLVNGIIVIFVFCVTALALIGIVLKWVIGTPWWICFPLVILYWIFTVIRQQIKIRKRGQ